MITLAEMWNVNAAGLLLGLGGIVIGFSLKSFVAWIKSLTK